MNPKVSIVMPVYNAGNYLKRSIESIIAGVFQEWELIIVDDGSTDGSSILADQYGRKDNRIRVIHQQNSGIAAARQVGVDNSKGLYCIHIDSDDWVEPSFLQELYSKAQQDNADMVWCDCYKNESEYWTHSCDESINTLINGILCGRIWGCLWNKLFKTSICQMADVRFPKGRVLWGEDMAFVIACLLHSKKISYCPKALYHYNTGNINSILHITDSINMAEAHCKITDYLVNEFEKTGKTEEYKDSIIHNQLWAVRDYIDDIRIRNYAKFMNTYPEAMAQINYYPSYPIRLKMCAWLINHHLTFSVPIAWRFCILLRNVGLMKDTLC